MDNTILTFPSAPERADIEFERTGQNDYIRAFEASITLYGEALAGRGATPEFGSQFTSLLLILGRLRESRPDMLDELVILDDGSMYPIGGMARVIHAMAKPSGHKACNFRCAD